MLRSSLQLPRAIALVLVAVVSLAIGPSAIADQGTSNSANPHWVASWATSPAAYFVYAAPVAQNQSLEFSPTKSAVANIQPDLAFPFPNSKTTGATAVDQTIRSIVKPDLWDNNMRVRFSNVFGNQPLTLNATTVGLQEYAGNLVQGTVTPVTFGGAKTITIPAGQEVWSDGVRLSWVDRTDNPLLQGRNLAISYSIQGDSGHMTHHSGANMTSFITAAGSGDHTQDLDGFAYEYTTTSWFFLTAVDVMAPADTVVVCVFGDSITDGTHTTLNTNDRWANVLSRRLHDAYGNKVSVVNEAIGGNRVIDPVVDNATAGPAAVDRLDRDVLGLSGLTHVIWLEGINDLGAGYGQAATATPVFEDPVIHTPENIIAGYQNVVARLHSNKIKVYGGTIISALGMNNPEQGWDLNQFPDFLASADNGPVIDGHRQQINQYIRTSGLFDGVVDFDKATTDPTTGNMRAAYLPNSQFTQLPWDYLHPNHAGYNAMGLAIDLAPFAPGLQSH
ncbi:MAG: lysophospholipase [Chloroflexi bacterium]|nr:lysophospholipase [Chloroflexota bacterium]MBV9897736.1 lysophospholipase [Chloroflexota bacterium]